MSNLTYYRDKLRNQLDEKISSINDIRKLPILYKRSFAEQNEQSECKKDSHLSSTQTSGITGERLSVPIYFSEIAADRDLIFRHVNVAQSMPLTLSIMGFGSDRRLSSIGLPVIPVHLNHGLKHIVELLQKTYTYPGIDSKITLVEGNLLSLRRLTIDLLNQGYDPSAFGIKIIASTGWFITRRLRKFMEDVWDTTVVDRYRVVGVFGDTKYCKGCELYHFDFTVIAEVVHPLTLLPIKEGIGALILTGLYPFNQAKPLIRYWVGDFFEIKTAACGLNEPSYRFKGRAAHTIYWIDREKIYYLLFPTDVVEVLDEIPDIARKVDTQILKFRVEANFQTQPFQIRLLAELRYRPELYPRRIAELKTTIAEGLMESNCTFGHFIRERTALFNIEFLAPEMLASIFQV